VLWIGSGSGFAIWIRIQEGKKTHKNRNAGCSLLRAEGFFL
jgi:hypothetical protein